MSRENKIEVLVLGLGNELLMDDGAGVHVARMLQKESSIRGVVIVEAGTAILHIQHLIEQAVHVIAIDAVKADGRPGEVYRFDIDQARLNKPDSLHDLGIVGVLQLIPKSNRPTVTILGIEPEKIDYSMELSDTVRAAVGRVVQIVRELILDIMSRRSDTLRDHDK